MNPMNIPTDGAIDLTLDVENRTLTAVFPIPLDDIRSLEKQFRSGEIRTAKANLSITYNPTNHGHEQTEP